MHLSVPQLRLSTCFVQLISYFGLLELRDAKVFSCSLFLLPAVSYCQHRPRSFSVDKYTFSIVETDNNWECCFVFKWGIETDLDYDLVATETWKYNITMRGAGDYILQQGGKPISYFKTQSSAMTEVKAKINKRLIEDGFEKDPYFTTAETIPEDAN